MEDRDQNSLLGQLVHLSTRAEWFPTGIVFMVLTNLVLRIQSNEAFIKLPIYSDYFFHEPYPQTLLLLTTFFFLLLLQIIKIIIIILDIRKQAVWNTNIALGENMLSNVSIGDFWDIHQHMSHLIDSLALPSVNGINIFRDSFYQERRTNCMNDPINLNLSRFL